MILNLEEQTKYNSVPLITPNLPEKQLTPLLETAQRVLEDAQYITTPTLILSAEKDYVVKRKIQGDFYAKLASPLKKIVLLKDFYHGVLYESHQ